MGYLQRGGVELDRSGLKVSLWGFILNGKVFGPHLVVLGRCLEPWVGFTKELGWGMGVGSFCGSQIGGRW